MKKEFKAIIFDFGGVLTTSTQGDFTELGAHLARVHNVEEAKLWEVMVDAWNIARTDRTKDRQFWQRISRKLGISETDFRNQVRARTILRPGMVSLVKKLGADYHIALLSNHIAGWLDWLLSEHDLRSLFDVLVTSYDVGLRKPDPDIYKYTVHALNIPAKQCIFIDDMERNTIAAEAVGMTAIQFKSQRQLEKELRLLGVTRATP